MIGENQMNYVLNLPLKNISREEFNSRFSEYAADYIILIACCNILSLIFLIIRVFTGELLFLLAIQKGIKITILFGLAVFMTTLAEKALYLKWPNEY